MSIRSAMPALAAALLFGASTPLAKLLIGDASPTLLAGLLYLGSGIGLAALIALRHFMRDKNAYASKVLYIPRVELPWLLGAILFGGVFGPVLLMQGLVHTSAASASLLLNVEGVMTAAIAWIIFKENAGYRIVLGMAVIVVGSVLLSWEPGGKTFSLDALLIVGACLCWAIDNNLTRKVSTNDAMLVSGLKGLLAGASNTAVAFATGASLPPLTVLGSSQVIGFFGYGLSLMLFVVALRTLGTARTGAYFSVAPLFGVVISLILWPDMPSSLFWVATALMSIGVWLHVQERHEHEHVHEPLKHSHMHRHDAHHQHEHTFAWDGKEPHSHPHRHDAMTHTHAHYPDIHHQHSHKD